MTYTGRISDPPMAMVRGLPKAPTVILWGALLSLPFMAIQISGLQPAHVWLVATLFYLLLIRSFTISLTEACALLFFLGFAGIVTFLQDYPRVKSFDQIIKFALFYPGFYFAGRWVAQKFADRPLPLGYAFLLLFLGFQYVTQVLELPVIYKEHLFGQGTLNGTFRERNWLAVYFLLLSYVILLKDESRWRFVPFFLINAAVTLLSGSKTTFVACGIIFLLQARANLGWKVIPMIVGAVFYMTAFADEFSEEKLNVKFEQERGLAYEASMKLIGDNPVGYGFGFVEAYFGSMTSESILGLGTGVNAVFSAPIDLYIIAGAGGLVFWAVFFAGVGNQALTVLLPVAALTLLNPLHQSEIVYFFCGMLTTFGRMRLSKRWTSRRTSQPSISHPVRSGDPNIDLNKI